jgi:hypothetical protein
MHPVQLALSALNFFFRCMLLQLAQACVPLEGLSHCSFVPFLITPGWGTQVCMHVITCETPPYFYVLGIRRRRPARRRRDARRRVRCNALISADCSCGATAVKLARARRAELETRVYTFACGSAFVSGIGHHTPEQRALAPFISKLRSFMNSITPAGKLTGTEGDFARKFADSDQRGDGPSSQPCKGGRCWSPLTKQRWRVTRREQP